MSETVQHPNSLFYGPLIPESIMTASRAELTDLELEIEGQLPEDLQGHVFIVAPVGTVDSGGLPFYNGSSLLNGDGMIYRLDFDCLGKVKIKTRLVKPPDYYADLATRTGTQYENHRFRNHGITRFSLTLGLRNDLNTAFLPMYWGEDSLDRLLVTYDAGRPYELDTENLEVVTPIGSNEEWKAEINSPNFPFRPILSTAHPVFDAYTDEMFTVNYGRAVSNFLQTFPTVFELDKLPKEVYQLASGLIGFFGADILRDILRKNLQSIQELIEDNMSLIRKLTGVDIEDFVYLIRWDGTGNLERWKLLLPDGSPVKIEQTMHQIGITQDYIILIDTAFIAGIEQVLNNPLPDIPDVERTLRELLENSDLPDSVIYLVRRCDLKAGQHPIYSQQEVPVLVKKLVIPMSSIHFLVDYENPEGKVTLHLAHTCAWPVAEWIRKYDLSAYPPHEPISTRVYSMVSNEMDIGRLGRYVIDGDKAEIVESKVIYSSPHTWGTGLYAYRERSSSRKQVKKIENIYWCSFGLWPEIMTKFLFELYKNYPYRAVSAKELLDLSKQGIPSCLFRVKTSSMLIVDSYEFPTGYIGSSPQFIPRSGSEDGSTDGYIICNVFTPQRSEYWIFDATNLKKAPLCKLSHPSLKFGFSIHTTWLPQIGYRQAGYNIPVKLDYQKEVGKSSLEIQKLFEDEVYPNFK